MDSVLTVKNLKKIYHTKDSEIISIKKVSFDVKDKEFVSIVGPSGAGKSTILSILADIIPYSGGIISFKKDNPVIGYMLQQDALFPWLTILENALIGISVKRKPNSEEINHALSLLDKYGLASFKDSYPDNLSGGMRQRVALIRTLVINPDILLLDEPFSSLDYQTRLSLSDDVYKIIKNEGKTAIMVTHDLAEAISMSDRIIVLSKRPCIIKNVYNILLEAKNSPTNNRKDKNFIKYYDAIWKDLDHYV